MIQSVNALSPRVCFRGSAKNVHKLSEEKSKSQIALINATTTSIAAGGLTTAVARSYTSSWAHAGVLGLFGSMLTMFFIAPFLVENTNFFKLSKNSAQERKMTSAENKKVAATVKEVLKPTKKLVQFGQS